MSKQVKKEKKKDGATYESNRKKNGVIRRLDERNRFNKKENVMGETGSTETNG